MTRPTLLFIAGLMGCEPNKTIPFYESAAPDSADSADREAETGGEPDGGDSAPPDACPEGTACDDGDACTTEDVCGADGICAGTALDCDDGDACTTDTCAEGVCAHDAPATPLDLWDMAALGDASTLDLEIVGVETIWEGLVEVEVTELRYTSWEYDGCSSNPIRIEAYLAAPQTGASSYPGLALAHGLGGMATAEVAADAAADLDVFTLAWSGPGQGASEGTTCSPDHLFDTVEDPRASWFWEHAAAGIRGLTVLESWTGIDPDRLAVTGYSAGGLAALTINGVDARVDASVPVSASGYLDLAATATPTPGWEVDLLAAMDPPRTTADPEWTGFVAWLDPLNYLATAHGATLLINGAQDEFFPIHSTVSTFDALVASGADTRVLHIPNWDHGWFATFDTDEPERLTEAGWSAWLGHALSLDGDLAGVPPQPQIVEVVPWTCFWPDAPWIYWSCALVVAEVDTSTGYEVDAVELHFSVDQSYTYTSWNLELDSGTGLWWAEVGTLDGAVYDASNTVWFVEAQLRAGVLGPEFSLTSAANIPPGFSPNIIPISGPLP